MNRIQYIVAHALETPKGRWITKGDIDMWHMGPLDLPGGKVKFLGKVYRDRNTLPDVKINRVPIHRLYGRGWDRSGYADIMEPNGDIINITPYNWDAFVDKKEITWGAVGVNTVSRHVALAGGIHPVTGETNGTWEFKELYTYAQFVYFSSYLKRAVKKYPWVKIIGHGDVPGTDKTCPNIDMSQFCRNIGIDEKNIGLIT